MNRLAVRSAVVFAHRLVLMNPASKVAAPQPATLHQPAWLASAKPVRTAPCSADSTADPMTATPSEVPTCRLVEAIAAASPAWDGGMLDTAVLLIAGFTMPTPIPKPA